MRIRSSLLGVILALSVNTLSAQSTTFSYQGNLENAGSPANGNHDFEFALFDSLAAGAQLGSTLSRPNVVVSNGVFSVSLDFGSQFPGANRFLEIRVRPSGGGAFTPLTPRQAVDSSPYAIKSLSAENASNATNATNATQLGGVAANQYVLTGDARLSDARQPTAGSASYIQNQNAAPQASSSFNISGTGTADILNAATQFNMGGSRVLSIAGTNNIFAGVAAGQANTGSSNSFFGRNAGFANTTGAFNSFFGFGAGDSNITGNNNAFFGQGTGQANTTGGSNAFFGETAGFFNSTGDSNSFFGGGAGAPNTTGFNNSFFGREAGLTNTTGNNNTILGANANLATNNLTFATAIGANAVVSTSNTITLGRGADTVQVPGIINSATQYNLGGSRVLSVSGNNNIFAGVGAGQLNTTGERNSFYGESAGANNTTANFNSFFGRSSGSSTTGGSFNSFFGANAGGSTTTGIANSFFGTDTGFTNTIGERNSFFGFASGQANTTGSNNTIVGTFANLGFANLTFATALGSHAVVTSNDTIVLGKAAGTYNSVARPADTILIPGNLSVAGIFAAPLPSGSSNYIQNQNGAPQATSNFNISGNGTAGGTLSGDIVNATTQFNIGGNRILSIDGSNTIFVGRNAGQSNTTGFSNAFFGFSAGSANTTGLGNTAVGAGADVTAVDLQNATAIGFQSKVSTSNSLVLGSINGVGGGLADTNVGIGTPAPLDRVHVVGRIRVTALGAAGATALCRNASDQISTCSSSGRYKSNIAQFDGGLELLKRLRPVSFNWKDGGMRDLGLVAEDVAKVEPLLTTTNGEGEIEGVKYDRIGVVLINAVKEQQAQIDDQKKEIERQRSENERMSAELEMLKQFVCGKEPAAAFCGQAKRKP